MRIDSTTLLAGGLAVLPNALACDPKLRPARDAGYLSRREVAPRADTSNVKRPQFGQVPYGISVGSCTVPGKVAITIDDGFDQYTSDLLDIFKRNNAKATFFVVGDNGRWDRPKLGDPSGPFPALMKRAISEGHQLGSHSWSHQDFAIISPDERKQELLKLEGVFVDVLGFFPTYFRPPYTSFDEAVVQDLRDFGYHNVNYDLDTEDWKGDYPKAKSVFSAAVSSTSPSTRSHLVLMHELDERSVHDLAQNLIDEAKKNGYDLVTVGECLGDPPNNWYRDPATGGPRGGAPPTDNKTITSSSSSSSTKSASTTTTPSSSSKSDSSKSSSSSSKDASITTTTGTITTTPVQRPPAQSSTGPAAATSSTPPAQGGAGGLSSLISLGGVFLSGLALLAYL
jgi:peptidoglycan/xylan/chitin deacetylase (PgdA/CDA1 family)